MSTVLFTSLYFSLLIFLPFSSPKGLVIISFSKETYIYKTSQTRLLSESLTLARYSFGSLSSTNTFNSKYPYDYLQKLKFVYIMANTYRVRTIKMIPIFLAASFCSRDFACGSGVS